MTADLAHMGMPKSDRVVRLLFLEVTDLGVLLVRACSRVYTVLAVLRSHFQSLRLYSPMSR